MGLDLSVYKIEKVNNVPFKVIYNAVDDETLKEFLKENEKRKTNEIQYLKDEGWYTGEFLDERIAITEKNYNKYANYVISLNHLYNDLSKNEKEAISNLAPIKHRYYGKNWDLFKLLDHELCGNVFNHEFQSPVESLSKEILENLFKITQSKNPQNEGLKHLQSLLSKGDFDNFHYYIEAWY